MTDIVLNLKKVKFKAARSRDPQPRALREQGRRSHRRRHPGPRSASKCSTRTSSSARSTRSTSSRPNSKCKVGRGFATGDENKHPDQPIGVIADRLDLLAGHPREVRRGATPASASAPITTSSMLEIWTDGRITPEDALCRLPSILKKHFEPSTTTTKTRSQFDETPQPAEPGKSEAEEASEHERERDRALACARRTA